MNASHDQEYLKQALSAAETRRGYCAPNPAVGAVIVKDGEVIATGTHWAAGHPHAEIDALHKAGDAAHDATMYVTLEPCCHFGKTSPCTDAIIKAGIKRVIFGFRDPHSAASEGREVLLEAGVECEQVSLPEINTFYRSYAHWVATGLPWVRLKLAISADNKIAGESGKTLQITGDACQALTQQYRYRSDAILTTINTIQNDNPKMNARLPDKVVAKSVFVLDSQLQLDRTAQIFKTAKKIAVYHRDDVAPHEDLDCVPVSFDESGLNLQAVLADIGRRGVHDLWVEVGARAFASLYEQRVANEIIFYRSKKVFGETALPAFSAINPLDEQALSWESLGDDEVARLTIE